MDFTGVASVVAITVICYLIGMAVHACPIDNTWIPIIVGVCGGIIGVVGFYIIPDYPAQDIINAIAVGIVSGLSATGVDQIYTQLSKNKEE